MKLIDYIKVTKKHFKNEQTYRDGIPKKQPNKVGTNDTTVPLRTPIPISFVIFPTRSYASYMEWHVYILWQFFESTLACLVWLITNGIQYAIAVA